MCQNQEFTINKFANQRHPLALGGLTSHSIKKKSNNKIRHYKRYGFFDLQLVSLMKESPSPNHLKAPIFMDTIWYNLYHPVKIRLYFLFAALPPQQPSWSFINIKSSHLLTWPMLGDVGGRFSPLSFSMLHSFPPDTAHVRWHGWPCQAPCSLVSRTSSDTPNFHFSHWFSWFYSSEPENNKIHNQRIKHRKWNKTLDKIKKL